MTDNRTRDPKTYSNEGFRANNGMRIQQINRVDPHSANVDNNQLFNNVWLFILVPKKAFTNS